MAENQEIIRRVKKEGVLGKLWNQTGNTLENSGGLIENATGITLDTLVLGRKTLAPSIIDANVEILQAMALGINDLKSMGVDEAEAREYIMNGVAV